MMGKFAGVTSVHLEESVRRLRRSTSPVDQADAIEAAAVLVLRLATAGSMMPSAVAVQGDGERLWWSLEWEEEPSDADALDVEWLIDRICPHHEAGAVAAMAGRRARWSVTAAELDAPAPADDDALHLLMQHSLIRTDSAVLDAVLLNESSVFSDRMLAAAARAAGERSRRTQVGDAALLVGLVRVSRFLLRLAPEAVAFMISIVLPVAGLDPERLSEVQARGWDGFVLPFDPGPEVDEEVLSLLRSSPGLVEAVIAREGGFVGPGEVSWQLMAEEVRRRYPDPGRPPPQET